MSFWTDPKIADDFTPDDKLFYLYLMTNPHTKLCGCYEASMKQMSDETGFTKDRIEKLLSRMEETHKVMAYSQETKEILLVNWHKYNWTSSEKFRIPLWKEIQSVKNADFRLFLTNIFNGIDTVSIPYQYRTDTTVTVTDTDSDTVTDTEENIPPKLLYYPNDEELDRAFADFVAMRKKIKAPMTEKAIELAINNLNKLSGGDSEVAIKIINQSVMNSWKGFYELKNNNKQQQDFFEQMRNA